MKSDKEMKEMQDLLCDTQFYYSEVCLCFSQLLSKKWYKPEEKIIIPSIANEDEIQHIEHEIEQIDVNIPSDDETNSDPKLIEKSKSGANFTIKQGRKKTNGKRVPIPWTNEEINAIKEGIKKYGVGQWVKIRSLNQEIFAKNGRTSHDISDKYRTLKNRADFKAFLKRHT